MAKGAVVSRVGMGRRMEKDETSGKAPAPTRSHKAAQQHKSCLNLSQREADELRFPIPSPVSHWLRVTGRRGQRPNSSSSLQLPQSRCGHHSRGAQDRGTQKQWRGCRGARLRPDWLHLPLLMGCILHRKDVPPRTDTLSPVHSQDTNAISIVPAT